MTFYYYGSLYHNNKVDNAVASMKAVPGSIPIWVMIMTMLSALTFKRRQSSLSDHVALQDTPHRLGLLLGLTYFYLNPQRFNYY